MLSEAFNIVTSLFAKRLTRQVRELYASTLILDLAVSMVTIFEPVFLYLFFIKFAPMKGALSGVLIFYLAVYVLYFLIAPLGAKFARRYGYENSIAVSTVFLISLYFCLFCLNSFSGIIIVAIIAYALAKSFYWPAFHANFARFSADGEQGRELSNLYVLESFIYVIGPLIGGLILQFLDFSVLFIVFSCLVLVSNVPMLITKEPFEPKPFSYFGAYRRLLDRGARRQAIAHFGYGEEFIFLVIWPIFMYLIASNYLGLGIISSISIFLTTIVLLFVGRLTDAADKTKILRVGEIFYFFSWLFKILVRNPFGLAVVDVYSRVSKNFIALPITAGLYREAQNGSVMNSIMFFEMSLVVGKIIAMILCLILLQIFSPGWNAMFIAGASMSVFYLLFKRR